MLVSGLASGFVLLAVASSGPRFYDPPALSAGDAETPAQAEVVRIQRHLQRVEETLRAETPDDLRPAQARGRAEVLDILHAYWVAGEFPKNLDYPDRRVPHFIDADGVACAVGYLMVETGADAMAREIATYENFDFVADIDHPGVGRWLDAHGLRADEAAWIQPTYGPCGFGGMPYVCGSDGNTYECEAIAVQCAGVDVVSEGICGEGSSTGGSGTDGTTGGDPVIIGAEICPVGTGSTGDPGTSGDTGTSGTSTSETTTQTGGNVSASGGTGDGSSGPGSSTAASTTDTPADDEDDKGCSCRVRGDAPVGVLPLLLLALIRRRRP